MRTAADALNWANEQQTWAEGLCENFVWNGFGAPVVIPAGGYATALQGWVNTRGKNPSLSNCPIGAPVYFTGPKGHVCFYKGGGVVRSTVDGSTEGLVQDMPVTTITSPRGWNRRLLGWGSDIFGYPITFTQTDQEDEMSQADIDAINAHTDTQIAALATDLRRERAHLYFDAGADGKTTFANATRVVLINVHAGFIYPLNPNPAERAGQLSSLEVTAYPITAPGTQEIAHPQGLPTTQFNNMIEMANSHLRRLAAEVVRQAEPGAITPPVTAATVPTGSDATPALAL